MSSLEITLKVILLFFVLVTIHEWGHFYFAKRAGILVREFAIGFGPKLFTFKKDETRFTLRLLPIGGFVRMAGEDPEMIDIQKGQTIAVKLNKSNQVTHLYLDQLTGRSGVIQGEVAQIDMERKLEVALLVGEDDAKYDIHPQAMMVTKGTETQIAPYDRQFGSKTVGQRALSIVMGPVMNFLLAVVLFCIVVIMAGVPTNTKLESIVADQPAQHSGLLKGDIVKSVNGKEIGKDATVLTTLIQGSPSKVMNWIVVRNGQEVPLQVTPSGEGKIGVVIGFDKRSANFNEVLTGTWDYVSKTTVGILDGFKKLVFGQVKMDDLGGPVRIVEVTGQFVQNGMTSYIYWAAIFSLYLGLFNLLPFPALDGSRLVFLGIEAVRGKPVDPSRESIVHFVGFALLMLLMVVVTYNDIVRLIKS
ncbi:RIP metalloprotease RseP [Paenibacillus sp. N1-5-1-14]|uniref:RIP metalloprotease RseP n=1 Tax=Paenibacillus radicibacter TaxID=2972488 RepID=UPI0021590CFA|nr:RIP metalloprotease RseP [Paenibacillus radicibacter]MCR8642154.1 RIP metalloprotease RseP [Paenibacillus radicibacter]